jgi:hypothetical protein
VPAHTGQETALDQRKYFIIGLSATALGLLTTIAGFLFAHFAASDLQDELGKEVFPFFPDQLREWYWVLAGETVSLSGVLLGMAGLALAFLYRRKLTWARATLGAALFTGLMIIIYGIIPNQWLSLAQGEWEWTSAKKLITLPKVLTLNNEVSFSYEALKDAIAGTYVAVVTGVIALGMYQWQEIAKRRAAGPPPKPVSVYGRPVTKIGRG